MTSRSFCTYSRQNWLNGFGEIAKNVLFGLFSPNFKIWKIEKTVKNAYFSKIQNSLKVSNFLPNCSRNNRVSMSKNKGVDFLMQIIVFHKFKMPAAGLIFNVKRNGFQILVRREIFHKISHFVAKYGFGPNLVCSQHPQDPLVYCGIKRSKTRRKP